MPPVRIYENWTKREAANEEQIEPYRKYFIICEGEKTEAFYFKILINKRKELGIHSMIDIRFMEKTGEDVGLSHPKALIRFAEEQKKIKSNTFDPDHDKMVIVFDADVFRAKPEILNQIAKEGGVNNTLGITFPSFELFLLLHYDRAFEDIIKPNEHDLLINKKNGNRRIIDKLFSDKSGMNSKSNPGVGELVSKMDIAIDQEKKLNQNLNLATEKLTSNIGSILAQIKEDKPK